MIDIDKTVIGFKIIEFDEVVSTNETAKKYAGQGCAEGTVVIAKTQSGGKGQNENIWHSQVDKGLYFSIILRPTAAADISKFTLMTGVALNSSLRAVTGLDTLIKLPNDIYFDNKKLAGVLCETAWQKNTPEYVIIGIGINVEHSVWDFPPELRQSAASLFMCGARTTDKKAILNHILEQMDIWYKMTAQYGFDAIYRLYNAQRLPGSQELLSDSAY